MLLLEACPPVSASRHDDRCKKLLRWSLGLRPARPLGLPCPLVGSREAFDGNDALGRKPGCVLAAVLPHPADGACKIATATFPEKTGAGGWCTFSGCHAVSKRLASPEEQC